MAVLSPVAEVLRPPSILSASFPCSPITRRPDLQKRLRVRYSFSSVSVIPKAPTTSSQSAGIFAVRGCVLRSYPASSSAPAFDRRELLLISTLVPFVYPFLNALDDSLAIAAEFADMPALRGKDYGKTKMRYPDYMETQSGLQYKDLRLGDGPKAKKGEIVVIDWDGYTIGYYGRIFEARNKTKGGSFEGEDKEFLKFKLGSKQVIPAFEEAITGMAPGGIRRIIVPPELGYPENDFNKLGPRPTTFSGQRALDFVLRNQGLIDKTLLFDIELLKIIPS
ncbi:Peptidyl-prolyl cis-trans isomerase FKBP19, chloroplastic [Apostasia shenzhenica]|uniref:peptidylprolyl isomerase n=1 Tax=Apostasia shenzhenica TaxID=1088818 RepID=A0A2I0AEU8_9ASPA|nr:Peptidyl-prolyl cis-trans isomerase FKBP19, chloroplastic [Apostasia shenzhenica]